MGAFSDLRARQSGAISVVREPLGKAAQVQRVQYAIRAYAPLARHRHAPTHEVELGDGMSIGIDAEHAAQVQTALVPSPVEIEPPRVGVDLNGDAVIRARLENFLDIDLIARPARE
jgi:hypothetical protein